MTWLRDGRLRCQNHLTTIFDHPGPRTIVIEAARDRGWIVFEHHAELHLCPECADKERSRRRLAPVQRLEGEVPLWSDDEQGS